MATEQELMQLQDELQPIVKAAIDRGEDLSTPELMLEFIKRTLTHNGYVQRGDNWVLPIN